VTPRVLLIDNHDSFTWNLVQALGMLGAVVTVRTNDAITADEAAAFDATHLVISPGPGRPERAGATPAIIERLMHRMPVLGVCLGHQALAAILGGAVVRARRPVHGKTSSIYHDGATLYEGLPNPFPAGRYHSLAVAAESLPPALAVSAYTSEGEVMGVRHRTLPAEGVQFHPESILTPQGERLLRNFLDLDPPAAVGPPAAGDPSGVREARA
jgi:anthranilate synthase/aminodeoxychorismate synthase-like glutamine amidotransferase